MANKKRKNEKPINRERLAEAYSTLARYQRDKASLNASIVENEGSWLPSSDSGEDKKRPFSAWTFNSLACKHADAMDNIPVPTVLPRESSDSDSAKELSLILPVVLGRSGFEKVWSDCWYDKLKFGCGVYGVFWDSSAENGVGDVRIRKIDLMNLYWEKGVEDVQESENLFYVSYQPRSRLIRSYPHIKESLDSQSNDTAVLLYNGDIDMKERCAVVDWYYKKLINGKTVVHYCKSVNGTVLYASENDPLFSRSGYYDHGLYPFVFDSLYSVRHSPCGHSFLDIMKNCQRQIDLLEGAISDNSRMASTRRYFAREASGINEEEFADWSSPIVHYNGSGDPRDSVMPIDVPALDGVYLQILQYKVNELKETSGNRDFSQGGTSYGVTAASAIEALQEAGSKLSRDMLKSSYRAFEELCLMIIELIRQFYTLPRCFRIVGEDAVSFRYFDNSSIKAQKQGVFDDRLPVFDVSVKAQKQSPYAKASQNELARSFFEKGFFTPEKQQEALICLEMMDFDGKDAIYRLIKELKKEGEAQ